METYPHKLGIVAGGGDLPVRLQHFCDAHSIPTFTIGFNNHTDGAAFAGRDHAVMRLGEAGKMVRLFKEQGCNDLVLIGSIKRPSAWELRPDFYTAKFFARIGFKAMGDDGLLKAIRYALEDEGFTIHGIHEFLPDLLAAQGVLGKHAPSEQQQTDVSIGFAAAKALGLRDAGQCVVVHEGAVIAEEDADGTDAMLRRNPVRGAILVKTCKPQQDRKLDMPTVGRRTVRLCAELGYAGIAVEAGATLIANREEAIAMADEAGLFVVGL